MSLPSDWAYDRATNKIANAVDAAIDAGMPPEDFKKEAALCWEQKLRDDAKRAVEVLRGKP